MKKKLMMIAVLLGALSLGACVDDNESASVTDLRSAKAEQLRALANLSNAQAEAETIRANAEAALKEAQAAYKQALADQEDAETDFLRQKYTMLLEKLEAEYAEAILQAQLNAAGHEKDIWNKATAQIQNLFTNYKAAVMQVNSLNSQLLEAQFNLANAEVDRNAAIAEYNASIAKWNNKIINQTAKLERLQSLGTDKAALAEALNSLRDQAYQLIKVDKPAAEQKIEAAEEAFETAELPISYPITSTTTAEEEAEWRSVATAYVLAIDTLQKVEAEYNVWSDKRLDGDVELVESSNDNVKSENVLNLNTQSITTWALSEGADYVKATQEIAYMYTAKIEELNNNIGAPAAGSTPAWGYYSDLVQLDADLKGLQADLAAEQAKETPNAATVKDYEEQIAQKNIDIQEKNDEIADAKEDVLELQANQAAYTRNLAVVTVGSEAQKAYAAAVEALEGLAVAVIDAKYEKDVIEDKIEVIGIQGFNDKQGVIESTVIADSEYETAQKLYQDAITLEEAINACNKAIADAQEKLANCGDGTWETKQVNVWNPMTDKLDQQDIKVWTPNYATITIEEVQAILQAEIDRITAELGVQQALAERYKAALDAAIAAQDDTETPETPSEDETPSEEQPSEEQPAA